jgi:hypothetical protein
MDKEKIKSDVSRFKKEFIQFFTSHNVEGIYFTVENVEVFSDKFIEIYAKRPIKENTGGTGIKPGYWLFVMAGFLDAELIIESGVWRGQSAWLLRQANPRAVVHAFDISLQNLEYRDSTIKYHKMDWYEYRLFCCNPERSIIFFDDHINQARRVQEAHRRGFKWVFFDDNVSPDMFYRVGRPPLPTIEMLYNSRYKDGDTITWELQGTKHDFVFSLPVAEEAKKLISHYYVFPTATCLTLVQLKQP